MCDNATIALLTTFVAGASTAIGAALTFFIKRNDFRVLALGMSFSAGVMIYLSFMDIIPMSISHMGNGGYGGKLAEAAALFVFFAGAAMAALIDYFVPDHVSTSMLKSAGKRKGDRAHKAAVMTAIAIAVHNFPEGLAVFVTSMQDIKVGAAVGLAIMLHNIPEGISVALPIYGETGNKRKAFTIAALSGLAEPAGAICAYLLFLPWLSPSLIGGALAFTAGIMVYISLDELLPMAKEYGHEHYGIIGVFLGMGFMAGSLLLL